MTVDTSVADHQAFVQWRNALPEDARVKLDWYIDCMDRCVRRCIEIERDIGQLKMFAPKGTRRTEKELFMCEARFTQLLFRIGQYERKAKKIWCDYIDLWPTWHYHDNIEFKHPLLDYEGGVLSKVSRGKSKKSGPVLVWTNPNPPKTLAKYTA